MNKKRITEFSIYLQAFMQRIVTRFQIPGIFLMMKRWKWWKNFQSLFQQKLKVTDFSHQIGPFSKWRKTNGLLWCCWWKQKKYTPEECVQSINMLSSAIRSIHRDILLYSSSQGELLSLLKDFYGSSFSAILWNNLNISRSHAFFLMKFYKFVTNYPRLLWSKLPLKYFPKNFSWWRERGLERTVKFAEKTTNECDWIYLKVINDICDLKSFLFHIFILYFTCGQCDV